MGFALVFRRYAPFAQFGFGFEGDHRKGPSISMQSTSRTIGIVPFEKNAVGEMSALSSGTKYTGLGDWFCQKLGSAMSNVTHTLSNVAIGKNGVSFTASTAGANPMLKHLAPDIDTYVDFTAEWAGGGIRFSGSVRGDDFPNAEVFVLDLKGTGCLLFDGRTTGGQNLGPMTRLAGAHEGKALGAFNCSMPLMTGDLFRTPRTSCPLTTMEVDEDEHTDWAGGGGGFSGAGASGSF